jgi:hypothetical protein
MIYEKKINEWLMIKNRCNILPKRQNHMHFPRQWHTWWTDTTIACNKSRNKFHIECVEKNTLVKLNGL